jgi:hypothetical protein
MLGAPESDQCNNVADTGLLGPTYGPADKRDQLSAPVGWLGLYRGPLRIKGLILT